MENNFDDIIESVLNNSAVWISGPYGAGKTHILYQIKDYFINRCLCCIIHFNNKLSRV